MKYIKFLLPLLVIAMLQPAAKGQYLKNKIESLKKRRAEKVAVTDLFRTSGYLLNYAQIQDTKLSPLHYPGTGAGFEHGIYRSRPTWFEVTTFGARANLLTGPETLSDLFYNPSFSYESVFYKKLQTPGLAIGGSIGGHYQLRVYEKIGNDAYNHDGIVSLGISGAYSRAFTVLNRPADWYVRLVVPVFSYVNRMPDYNLGDMSHYFAPIGRFNRVNFTAGLVKDLKHSSENRIAVAYQWDFYAMNENNKMHRLYVANHSIIITYWLRKIKSIKHP